MTCATIFYLDLANAVQAGMLGALVCGAGGFFIAYACVGVVRGVWSEYRQYRCRQPFAERFARAVQMRERMARVAERYVARYERERSRANGGS